MKIKNIVSFSLLIISSLVFSGCIKTSENTAQNLNMNQQSTPILTPTPTKTTADSNQEIFAAIKLAEGQIVLKLYTQEAPNTVANFLKKSINGFYNNLTFHRVIPGFVAQGGDPLGNGTGGGNIKSEINSIPFKRGSLGLARGGNIEISNDSQFFICLTDEECKHLTNEYVNFGEVVSGFEYLDKIQVGDKIMEITTKTK